MRHIFTTIAILVAGIFGYLAYLEDSNIRARTTHLAALDAAVAAGEVDLALTAAEEFYSAKVRRPSASRLDHAEALSNSALKLWITRDAITPDSGFDEDTILARVARFESLQNEARKALGAE